MELNPTYLIPPQRINSTHRRGDIIRQTHWTTDAHNQPGEDRCFVIRVSTPHINGVVDGVLEKFEEARLSRSKS